jgi:hypothetical protein
VIKTLYQVVCILAIANVVLLIGVLVFLFGSGRLNAERVEQIAAVLRGEYPAEVSATTQPTSQPAESDTVELKLARAEEQGDWAERLLERKRREIEDRQRLVDAAVLDIVRRQEALAEERSAFEERRRKIEAQRLQRGFAKELELISTVKPKIRKDLLRQKSDADAVKLLMEMDERAGKQVIEACKTPEEKAWIARILHLIQTATKPESAETGSNQQEAR